MNEEEIMWKMKKDTIVDLVKSGKRTDKRDFNDYRNIELNAGMITKAEGSCWVKMGNTEVLVGVKLSLGQPYPDSPDEGVLITNAEMTPISSPEFESGPPRENAIEFARVVDRGIRESGMIDMKKLCIREGELIWMLLIDIHPLNADGNLIDAATLGAVKALQTAYMPEINEKDQVIREKTNKKLPLECTPIAVTFGKIGGQNVVDPTVIEEKAMDSRMTITSLEDSSVVAMQKAGINSYSIDEIIELTKIAINKGKELRKKL